MHVIQPTFMEYELLLNSVNSQEDSLESTISIQIPRNILIKISNFVSGADYQTREGGKNRRNLSNAT